MTTRISGGSMFSCHCPIVLLRSAVKPLFPCAATLNAPYSAIFTRAKIKAEYNKYRGPTPKKDLVQEWIYKNDNVIRTSPIYVGCFSLAAVLLNRTLSGISPIADASSSQSRADVLTLALAVTIVLTGLVWISIRPKYSSPVKLQGVECKRVEATLPLKATAELYWVWESLANITCCQALVIVYKSSCVLQVGVAFESTTVQGEAVSVDAPKLVQGSLCQGIWSSGKQNYMANLALYPGRFELSFLPQNTQAVILQPLGVEGVMIVAGDKIRGFSQSDQGWIALIGEKLDATLSKIYSEKHFSEEKTNNQLQVD